jgi:hypothetical protein
MDERSDVRVYSGPVLAMVVHLRHVLELNGIESEVRGEYRGAALGDIPMTEAWPELWVLDRRRAAEARRLVQDAIEVGRSEGAARECPTCHEIVESQFSECWNCGAALVTAAPEA